MPNNLVIVIAATAPIALLDVEDVLDNQHWKFCQDDGPDDDVVSYDEFEMGPDFILMAGTTVRINHLWGWTETGLTEPTDYLITIPTAATVKHVVHVMLSHYHGALNALDHEGRFFYIEQVSGRNGVVEITWGT